MRRWGRTAHALGFLQIFPPAPLHRSAPVRGQPARDSLLFCKLPCAAAPAGKAIFAKARSPCTEASPRCAPRPWVGSNRSKNKADAQDAPFAAVWQTKNPPLDHSKGGQKSSRYHLASRLPRGKAPHPLRPQMKRVTARHDNGCARRALAAARARDSKAMFGRARHIPLHQTETLFKSARGVLFSS